MEPYIYTASLGIGAGKLRKFLPEKPVYKITVEKGEKQKCTLLDTFENDLEKKALVLFRIGATLILVNLKTGQMIEQTAGSTWRFAWELERGPVASVLQDVSELRAYLPVAQQIRFRFDRGLLLDDEEKTRARFHSLILYRKDKTFTVGTTQYLRGYDQSYAQLIDILKKSGAQPAPEQLNIYANLGIRRKPYNPKPSIPIKSQSPAKESATLIIATLIDVARVNEPGIIDDIDTEFLHDYRVSFRKVRSVISLFKGIYNQEKTAELKKDFGDIMQNTNRLRDLDVYLLERDNYFKLVPQSSQKGLSILFAYLESERQKELEKVIKALKSKEYLQQVKKLKKLFSKQKHIPAGPKGELPSREFGARLIQKRYNQVCRIANTIDADTEDETVHQLRISCKKLRYLMEFFTPLFPQADIQLLIKKLKVLQDNLGKFNDYSVQQDFLRQIVTTDLAAFKEKELQVTESIGALTAMLFRLQLKERKQVMKNFSRFDNDETRTLFNQLSRNIEEN